MTGPTRKLAAVTGVTVLVLAATVGTLVGATGVAAAGNHGVDTSCADEPGGEVYETDSGLVAYENADEVYYGTLGTTGDSVAFGDLTLSAAGNAEIRVDNATGDRACFGTVDASENPVTVNLDGAEPIMVESNLSALAYRDPAYDPNDTGADLAVGATGDVTLTVESTGLAGGETVIASDTDNGSELDRTTVDDDGSLSLSLADGTHRVDLHTADYRTNDGNGTNDDSSGAGSSNESDASSNETTLSLGSETGINSTTAETGDMIQITLVIENTGRNATNESFNVTAGGETIFETDVPLSSGTERTIEFEHAFSDPGEYDIAVNSSTLGTESIDSVTVNNESETDTATAVAGEATNTETSGVSESDSPTTTDGGTTTSGSESGMRSLVGIGLGALLLFAMGAGIVIARRDGYEPGSGGESTTDSDSAESPSAPTSGGPYQDLSPVIDAIKKADIAVVDLQAGQTEHTLTYATVATHDDAAKVEIKAIVRSYVSAIDDGTEATGLEATILKDDETLGTWHIRSEWLEQLEEGTLSLEALEEKVFETVDRTG